ncbi:MAG: dihydroxyacetone kinase subunit DhaL [Caldilinea sp.]|nr:dihydroxyacetone kinase subunit DhaL [Caldilinea sp.]MDW8440811.1 dihydroxyacetone kinase subunit DhaL [Caldilineaceae bacterium]
MISNVRVESAVLIDWMLRFADKIVENKEMLTALDAAIGDADHGINMARGMEEVRRRLATYADDDLGALFKTIGMTLLSKVGGASGPLYGTLFLRMGVASVGKSELTDGQFAAALAAGVDGVRQRGSARLGDKTMVDALLPAVVTLQQALDDHASLCDAMEAARRAAEEGMKATIPMQASKGRASYLGPRSIGHQDPGATSAYLLILSAAEAICHATRSDAIAEPHPG